MPKDEDNIEVPESQIVKPNVQQTNDEPIVDRQAQGPQGPNLPNNGQINKGYNPNGLQSQALKKGATEVAKKIPGVGLLAHTPVGKELINKAVDTVGEVANQAANEESTTGSNPLTDANPLNTLNPLKSKKGISKLFSSKSNNEENGEKKETDASGEIFEKIKKYAIPIFISAIFLFFSLIALVCVVAIMFQLTSPLFKMGNMLNQIGESAVSFVESLGNFVTGCGWSSNEQCSEIENQKFFDKVKAEYNDYRKYGVELDTALIISTLTYQSIDSVLDDEEYDESMFEELNMEFSKDDYRKMKKMVGNLANEMAPVIWVEKIDPETGETYLVKTRVLDLENYRKYLEDKFIKEFYFSDYKGDDLDALITQTIDEIYQRVDFYKYLIGETPSSDIFVANNSQVTILDCSGNIVIDQVSLYEYLQGVLYVEGYATGRSEEFLKVMAVAGKNYLYAVNGAKLDSMPSELRIKSCQMNQIYCSVSEGCYKMGDSSEETKETIATGPDESGNYYREPITDPEVLSKIKNAIDTTLNQFIVKDNKIVATQYRSACSGVCDSSNNIMDQQVANEMIKSGKSYTEVLKYFYDGELTEVDFFTAGYPLDLKHNRVTSAFGWRVHPQSHICKYHTGTDIGAPFEANIYSIADGVVVINAFDHSYGNYTVIGHGTYNESDNTYEYYSLYAHQIRLSTYIKVGDQVKTSQKIGNVGNTGNSTGPHLHIEIYTKVNGKKVGQDAVEYFKNVELTGFVGGALYGSEEECKRAR